MARKMGINKKIENKFGVIDLEHPEQYKPWIRTQEVTSGSGRRHIIPDIYYPTRMVHLMSNLEKEVYYMLRCNRKVVELFEQVPLDLETTTTICNDLEVVHPKDPYTNQYNVMTTDFVAYIDDGKQKRIQAFAVKMSSALRDERTLEKLMVERKYWEMKHINWAIITEKTIAQNNSKERKYVRDYTTERYCGIHGQNISGY